jgi:uncharacterized protein involved in exopolysaccharide biosynthesis
MISPSTPLMPPAPEMPRAPRWTGRDLAIRLFYRIKLFSFCLILGTLTGVVAASLSKPTYTADTSLIILLGSEFAAAPQGLNLANQQISIDGLKAVQSEAQIIQADGTVRAAIEAVGLDSMYPSLTRPRYFGLLPPLPAERQIGGAIDMFHASLHVDIQSASNVIRVAFDHRDRAIAIKTVEALTAAYLAKRRAIYVSDETSALGQEIRRYAVHLGQIEADIQAVRRKFDVLDTAQDSVLATNRLDGIVQRQNQVRERRVAVETEIVAVRTNLTSQPPDVLDFRETTNNTGNDEARNTLVRLMQERTHLTMQYNSDWPIIHEVDRKIATVKAQISANGGTLYFSQRSIRNPALDVLNNRLASLEVEDKALSQQLVELEDQSHTAAARIASLREAEGELHTLQLNREVAEGIYRQLSQREPGAILNEASIIERNGAVRIAQAPTAPIQGRSLAFTYMAAGTFFSLLLAVAAVVVATMLQRCYILSNDAERDLGLYNLGEVETAVPTARTLGIHPGYGLVASNLLRLSVDGKPLSMIQIASSSDFDGSEDVARTLGGELARAFGMRTLILDLQHSANTALDLRGPPASLPSITEADVPIPIAATGEEDLWVSVNAHQALFGDRGRMPASAWQTIGSLREKFDMVLVIVPSSLADPLVHRMASVVDATLLAIYAERTRVAVVERYREMTLEAGGNLAGFVFVGRRFYVPRWLYRRL